MLGGKYRVSTRARADSRRPHDVRSDLYALGMVAYELLGGTLPFDGASSLELILHHMQTAPPPLAERCPGVDIPPALDAWTFPLVIDTNATVTTAYEPTDKSFMNGYGPADAMSARIVLLDGAERSFATPGASRHSSNTPSPTMPVAPVRMTFIARECSVTPAAATGSFSTNMGTQKPCSHIGAFTSLHRPAARASGTSFAASQRSVGSTRA